MENTEDNFIKSIKYNYSNYQNIIIHILGLNIWNSVNSLQNKMYEFESCRGDRISDSSIPAVISSVTKAWWGR